MKEITALIRVMSPQLQARIVQNQWKKKQQLLGIARNVYHRTTLRAARVGKEILEEGPIDPIRFEKELLRRMKPFKGAAKGRISDEDHSEKTTAF